MEHKLSRGKIAVGSCDNYTLLTRFENSFINCRQYVLHVLWCSGERLISDISAVKHKARATN